jgi:hypothetical protein
MPIFLYSVIIGTKIKAYRTIECIGPRCIKPGTRKSISGRIDARKISGTLTLAFRNLAVPFPLMYPRARCPTANIFEPRETVL